MNREFNETGLCVPNMHYMADTTPQMDEIFSTLIERGKYFSILGGRQFGKTTTIDLISKLVEARDDYFLIETSFEGIGDDVFEKIPDFCELIVEILSENIEKIDQEYADKLFAEAKNIETLRNLSRLITKFAKKINKKIVFIIDEVDKSSNNQLFLSFLGMLRDKYLKRNKGKDN